MALLALAHHVGVGEVVAVTGISASVAAPEVRHAKELCAKLGIPHRLVSTDELSSPDYRRNDPNRCFHCKSELYQRLAECAAEMGIDNIVDGTSAADLRGHRPGHAAARQQGVFSPWVTADANKDEIRAIARRLGVEAWAKPSSPCLASRVAYGLPVTSQRLDQVGRAEAFLRRIGLHRLRVRHHDHTARLEVPPEDFELVCRNAGAINDRLKALGFIYVSLDLGGLRSGSLLEVLD